VYFNCDLLHRLIFAIAAIFAENMLKLKAIKKQAAWQPGAADTVCSRLRARTKLHSFIAGRVDSACSTGVPILKFVGLPIQ